MKLSNKILRILKNENSKIMITNEFLINGDLAISLSLLDISNFNIVDWTKKSVEKNELTKAAEAVGIDKTIHEYYDKLSSDRVLVLKEEILVDDFKYVISNTDVSGYGERYFKKKDLNKRDFTIGKHFIKFIDEENNTFEIVYGIQEKYLELLKQLVKEYPDLKITLSVSENSKEQYFRHNYGYFKLELNNKFVGAFMPVQIRVNINDPSHYRLLTNVEDENDKILIGEHVKK